MKRATEVVGMVVLLFSKDIKEKENWSKFSQDLTDSVQVSIAKRSDNNGKI